MFLEGLYVLQWVVAMVDGRKIKAKKTINKHKSMTKSLEICRSFKLINFFSRDFFHLYFRWGQGGRQVG